MNKLVEAFPKGMAFGDSFHLHGLGVIQLIINGDIPNVPRLDTLDEALGKRTLYITETCEGGEVQLVAVENRGDFPVIILEGEELVGSKQNRVTSITVIVAAKTTVKIPVSCVERGRWHYTSDHFQSGNAIYRARSRAIQKSSVTANLTHEGAFRSDQGAVWRDTEKSLHELGVRSATSDFREAREHVAHQIEEFVEGIQPVTGQVGAIFYSKRGVIGGECFHSPDLFSRCFGKVLRSFCFEVLSASSLNGASPDPHKEWWAKVLDSPFSKRDSVGVGQDVRTEPENPFVLASGLIYGGILAHFSGFPNFQQQENRPTGRRLSARDRRRLRSSLAD